MDSFWTWIYFDNELYQFYF